MITHQPPQNIGPDLGPYCLQKFSQLTTTLADKELLLYEQLF